MSKQRLAHPSGIRQFKPSEAEKFYRWFQLQLGIENQPHAKIHWAKIKNNGLLISPVEIDDIIELLGGEAS